MTPHVTMRGRMQPRACNDRDGQAPCSVTSGSRLKSGRLILVWWLSATLYPVDRNCTSLVDGSRAPRSTSHMIFESWSASAPLR